MTLGRAIMKNPNAYKLRGGLLLIGSILSVLAVPASFGQISQAAADVIRCREELDNMEIRINSLWVLVRDYSPPAGATNAERRQNAIIHEKRVDAWKRALMQLTWGVGGNLSPYDVLCQDLKKLEAVLAKEPEVADPTPPPSPTPLPSATPPKTESSQSTEELWIKIKELLDRRFPPQQMSEVQEWIYESKNTFRSSNQQIGIDASIENKVGLRTVRYQLPAGNIRVNLPDDFRSGDTITGTVTAEPNGRTEEERNKNQTELNKYGVEIIAPLPPGGGATPKGTSTVSTTFPIWRSPSINSKITFFIPISVEPNELRAVMTAINVGLTKNDPNTNIPIEIVQLSLGSTQPIQVTGTKQTWQMPQIIQTGRPVEIRGPFDGRAGNTSVIFNGNPLWILAESPRGCVFTDKPAEVGALAYAQGSDIHLGSGEVTIKENGKQQNLPVRVVKLGLNAPKTNLMKGEKTTVNIEVSGLKGLAERESLPLQLTSSGVVKMTGGDSQSLQIRHDDVDKEGIFRTTRGVTGLSVGGWNVTATVIDPRWRPIVIPLIRDSDGNGYRTETRNGEQFITILDVRDPRTGRSLEGEHKFRAGCEQPSLGELPILSYLFKGGSTQRQKTRCIVFLTPQIIIED